MRSNPEKAAIAAVGVLMALGLGGVVVAAAREMILTGNVRVATLIVMLVAVCVAWGAVAYSLQHMFDGLRRRRYRDVEFVQTHPRRDLLGFPLDE